LINLKEGLPAERKKTVYVLAALLGAVLLAELLVVARRAVLGGAATVPAGAADPAGIGHLLFTRYLYPFEITSVLLVAALVGAMTLAGKKEGP
jgi:NADH-quinone oxidoreductase subunit J